MARWSGGRLMIVRLEYTAAGLGLMPSRLLRSSTIAMVCHGLRPVSCDCLKYVRRLASCLVFIQAFAGVG